MTTKLKSIQHIGPLSLANIIGLLYAVLGLIFGLFFAGLTAISAIMDNKEQTGVAFVALIIIVFMPVFYGLMGYISGLFIGFIYNFIAAKVGGIKVDIR